MISFDIEINLVEVSVHACSLFRSSFTEEAGAKNVHPSTARLALRRPGNENRSFWRAHEIPVVPRLRCPPVFIHHPGNAGYLADIYAIFPQ